MPAEIVIGGANVRLDASGCAMLIGEGALLVADLHLEKGSSYARGRQFLPPYDTLATLARLSEAVARLAPRQIVVLGDAFHDAYAGERLPREAVDAIGALAVGRRLVWIAGNHDPAPPDGLPGERCDNLVLDGLTLRHIPQPEARGEIAGHLHPLARVATRAGLVRRKCFISNGQRLILPAFGAFAGGLNVRDPAIAALVPDPTVHVLGERRAVMIGRDRLMG